MKLRSWILEVAGILLVTATTFSPLAHAQDNLRDGAPFNGYTGVKFDTANYAYDYLVDSSLSQDDPADKKFRTLQAAYAAAPAGTPGKPTVIGIKPDVYFLHAAESAPYSMQITKNYITLLGLTDDRRKVVLADNRGMKEGATNDGFILVINATGFTMMNLSVVDYCNLDYEYPGDPSKNLKMRSPVITQGVVIEMSGDKHVYSHVAFLGRLDTTVISTTRAYFTNVFVEGTEDLIVFGGGPVAVFKNSEAYFPTGSGGLASQGLTFINTVFKASKGMVFYTSEGNTEKSFGNPDTLIDCVLPARAAWIADAAAHQNYYSLTYRLKDPSGKPVRIRDSQAGPPTYHLSRELSDEEAKAFNPWNLLRAALPNGPVDDWDPANVRAQYQSNGSDVFKMSIIAGTAPAAGRSGGGPFFSRIVSPTVRTGATGAAMTVTPFPARANATITWSTPSNLVNLSSTTGNTVTITGNNHTSRAEWVVVKAKAADGYSVMVPVNVEPAFIDPPKFTSRPVVAAPFNGKVAVHYTLDLGGREDQSLITWYQCDDATCASPRTVAVSRGDLPLRTYTLTAGDVGKVLRVSIQPKHNISDAGPEVVATASKPIVAANVTSTTIDPNFRNFVPTENSTIENGEWTIIGTWTPVTGDNLVNGYGLRISGLAGTAPRGGIGSTSPPAEQPATVNGVRVANPYAALIYDRDEPTGDMTVKVVMSPDKNAGQGFALAGSPDDTPRMERADIFIKYDPRTRNGYSLRFWRTIQSTGKCMFQLYRIEDGVGRPLNDQQDFTGVFKPNTTITLSVVGTRLTVKGSNTTDGETLSLEGTITPNSFGGAGAFWSGGVTVGNSNVYSEFEISYPGKSNR
jgi:pectin methylesterase-like acyl-CoA thioesterase